MRRCTRRLGIEFRKAGKEGATIRLTIGDREASEEPEAADYIYLTETVRLSRERT